MEDAIALLKDLGFGEYEAKAYAGLLQRSPLNGYELARLTGIPRPNIYPVLQKLEERGAVLAHETPEGKRFSPVPPDQLTSSLRVRFESSLDAAQQALSRIEAPVEHEYVWNARGYPVLLAQTRSLIEGAQNRLLAAVWPQEAEALAEPIKRAESRGVDLTILCMRACTNQCAWCRGNVHRYAIAAEPHQRWLVLVADGKELLAGEVGPGDEAFVVRTRQRLLVDLANWYVRHTVALAAIMNDLGRRPDPALAPSTRAVLESVVSQEAGGGWLEQIRQLLSRPVAETN